jgi:hypothetical protein
MKKNTIFYFLILTILLGLSSCATNQLFKRNIIGAWQPTKVGAIDIKKFLPRDDTIAQSFNDEDYKMMTDLKQSLSKPDGSGAVQKGTMEDFSLMVNEAITPYRFTSDGFAARDNPRQPLKGTWKLNKKGTTLTITDVNTQEDFILQIDSLSSTKMVATNKNLNGLKVTYIKGK